MFSPHVDTGSLFHEPWTLEGCLLFVIFVPPFSFLATHVHNKRGGIVLGSHRYAKRHDPHVVVGHKIDGHALSAKSAAATNPVEVVLHVCLRRGLFLSIPRRWQAARLAIGLVEP